MSEQFELPQSFLTQLNEFSAGGYILIRMGEDGNPQVYVNFDNPIIAIGLIRYAQMWSSVLDEANENSVSESLIQNEEDEEDDGSETE